MELVNDIGNSLNSASQIGAPSTPRSAAELDSDDFFKLLITQLTNQDPLEPTGNEELLRQISSIRDIELSTTLTDSLGSLSGQQQFASSSSLIGQFVTGSQGQDGAVAQGLVVGVRFTTEGKPMLQLANGSELSLDKVVTIESPLAVAQTLVGQSVTGVDQRDRSNPQLFEGAVTSASLDENGEAVLELDTGESVRLRDVLGVQNESTAQSTSV